MAEFSPPSISLPSPPPRTQLKIFQFDARQNIYPVTLKVDRENYELKIERVVEPSSPPMSPTSPTSPPAKKPRRNSSFSKFASFRKRLSSKKTSNEPMSPTGVNNNLIPETISFDEIQEFRCSDWDMRSVRDIKQIEKELKVANVKSNHKYKSGVLLVGKEFNLKKYTFLVVEIEIANCELEQQRREPTTSANVCIIGTKGEWKRWVDELMTQVRRYRRMTYFEKVDLWYKKQFYLVLEKTADNHRLKIWKQFLNRLHHRITTQNLGVEYEALEPLLRTQDTSWCSGVFNQNEFEAGARYFLHSSESFNRVFQCFDEISNIPKCLSEAQEDLNSDFSKFIDIMRNYVEYARGRIDLWPRFVPELDRASNGAKAAMKALKECIVEQDPDILIDEKLIFSNYILDYLFSEDNTIWNPEFTKQYQDMDQPLSHYWISSSHNTYLMGDQFTSESSIECYIRALLTRCRCIEIDVWNGPNNKPIVKHGMTLTTSVPLKDVLVAVKTYAFAKTPYPLIISVENHCNLRQQRVMAKYFRKLFGKSLVAAPLETDESGAIRTLPSPNQLLNKVIIKGRSLPLNLFLGDGKRKSGNSDFFPAESEASQASIRPGPSTGTISSDDASLIQDEPNQCDCLMMDELLKCDENGKWIPCIFVLTHKKLYFIERHENDKDNVFGKSPITTKTHSRVFRDSVSSVDSNQDLHMDQLWFHGNVMGGRVAADALFQDFPQTGAFMVRNSGVNKGGYTLCFYGNGKVHHCHILTKMTNDNEKMFHLRREPEQHEIFPSLYELIEYYMSHPVVTSECQLKCLGPPVPQSVTHESKEWFYKLMNRKDAEEILQKLPLNGAFLGRYSSENSGTVVISYRYESVIKHCIIRTEGRYLMVSNLKFSKLEDLVEHYGRHAFYKDIKLSHPVGKELLRKSQQNDCPMKVYGCKEYVNSFVKTTKGVVRAIQNFTADPGDTELLSFQKGQKIVNVVKHSDGWWSGIREDQLGDQDVEPKQFCSSFVEEIEELDGPFGDILCKGSFDLGSGAKSKFCKDKNLKEHGIKFYISFKFPDGTKKKLGAKCSKRRIDEWVDMINYVVDKDNEGKMKLAKIIAAKTHKIASEYSDLIIYCKSMTRLEPEEIGTDRNNINVTMVKSLDETSAGRKFRSNPSYYVWYHQYAMTRIYPKGNRLNSSNLSPVQYWNFGSQMVALNWQTDDKAMQWNRGKFKENGNCGYVLKPEVMFPERRESNRLQFDPTRMTGDDNWNEVQLQIEIISGRLLSKQSTGPITPVVEVEVVGIDADCKKAKTPEASIDTGLNPYWNHTLPFRIRCPELALVQFSVYHMDSFSDKLLLGECTIPMNCIREGFRSVQLNNSFGELLLSSLLVNVTKYQSPKLEPEP